GDLEPLARDLQRVVDRREGVLGKLDVHHRTDDLHHFADVHEPLPPLAPGPAPARRRSFMSRMASRSASGCPIPSSVIIPCSAAVWMLTRPNPSILPKIDCSHATFWMISSGLSIIFTVRTPDSSITRCVVTTHTSARHRSHRQSAQIATTPKSAPAPIRSAGAGDSHDAPNAPTR